MAHSIEGQSFVADGFFQPGEASPSQHFHRLRALVREMATLDRVVVLVEDMDGHGYLVTHHPERINVRPRKR